MLVHNPILKYLFCSNTWLWDSKEVYCNQWTCDFKNITTENIVKSMNTIFSHSKINNYDFVKYTKQACFGAHYPLPQNNHACVLGLHFSPKNMICNLTHSQHVHYDNLFQPRSTNAKKGIYVVKLYHFNPFHFFTAYVEVNITKTNALEHPMWVIISPDSYFGYKVLMEVNNLFDSYSPEIEKIVTISSRQS